MMGHTPGPWDYEMPPLDGLKSDMATVAIVGDCRVGVRTGIPGGNYRDTDYGTDEADARLIAAAPALLAAAERVLFGLHFRIDAAKLSGNPVPVFDGIADLHDAIARATGETK